MKKKLINYLIVGLVLFLYAVLFFYQIEYRENAVSKIDEYNSLLADEDKINDEYVEITQELSFLLSDSSLENITQEINNKKKEINTLKSEIEGLTTKKESLITQYNVLKKKRQEELSHYIDGVITYNQFPYYPTGCESVALYILLKYYNVDVTVSQIVNDLPKGDIPYYENEILYGGNPYLEFIGEPTSSSSFGVFDKPIENVANNYKSGIINATGTSLNDILKIVKSNRPVLVWTTGNLTLPYISRTWIYKPTLETINWISGEHAVVIVGYNENQIIISDPLKGKIIYQDRATFESRYNYLGKRALYY